MALVSDLDELAEGFEVGSFGTAPTKFDAEDLFPLTRAYVQSLPFAAVADKIRKDIADALASPEVLEKYKSFGYEPFPISREKFGQFIQSESRRFGEVIKKANVSLD